MMLTYILYAINTPCTNVSSAPVSTTNLPILNQMVSLKSSMDFINGWGRQHPYVMSELIPNHKLYTISTMAGIKFLVIPV